MENKNNSSNEEVPIEIPSEQLSSDVLSAVVESFIQREGTDYGAVEISMEKKSEQIHKQIKRGDVKIVFDQTTETVSLMTANDFKRFITRRSL